MRNTQNFMKLFKFTAFCMCLCLLLPSCKENDVLTLLITHDIQIPKPLSDIADATVTYQDQSGSHTQPMVNGVFYHTSRFEWNGKDEIEKSVLDKFNNLRVTLKLKVPESQLEDGMKLLKDKNAHYSCSYSLTRDYENKNFWTGNNSSGTNTNEKTVNYVYGEEDQEYAYTIDEIKSLVSNQESTPLYEVYFSKAGRNITITYRFNSGQSKDGNKKNSKLYNTSNQFNLNNIQPGNQNIKNIIDL